MPSNVVQLLPPLPLTKEAIRAALKEAFPFFNLDDPVLAWLGPNRPVRCCPLCHGEGEVPVRR